MTKTVALLLLLACGLSGAAPVTAPDPVAEDTLLANITRRAFDAPEAMLALADEICDGRAVGLAERAGEPAAGLAPTGAAAGGGAFGTTSRMSSGSVIASERIVPVPITSWLPSSRKLTR